jgi:hypothetical protein
MKLLMIPILHIALKDIIMLGIFQNNCILSIFLKYTNIFF